MKTALALLACAASGLAADLPTFSSQAIVPALHHLSREAKRAPAVVPADVINRAEAESRRLGVSGRYILWGKVGDSWLFTTQVGYGGTPGPVFAIKETAPADEQKKPNQPLEPTRGAVTPRAP
jgi:hypothetical protein